MSKKAKMKEKRIDQDMKDLREVKLVIKAVPLPKKNYIEVRSRLFGKDKTDIEEYMHRTGYSLSESVKHILRLYFEDKGKNRLKGGESL